MYIHVGEKKIISDKNTLGIFNYGTLIESRDNDWIVAIIEEECKTVVVDIYGNVTTSNVSPYTVIKRTNLETDIIWRKNNGK